MNPRAAASDDRFACAFRAAALLAFVGCTRTEPRPAPQSQDGAVAVPASPGAPSALRRSDATSLRAGKTRGVLEHSPTAFTQGLAFWRGRLFEGTGLYGASALRELDPNSGKEIRHVDVEAKYFGEGITILDGRLYELTWKEHTCLVYDVDTLRKVDEIPYRGEGWGLTSDGARLISSDGSSTLQFRDPKTFRVLGAVSVVSRTGEKVVNLNELEFAEGYVWANVWLTDRIVKIEPATGLVVETVDMAAVVPARGRSSDPDDVLNGIAFDPETHRFLITGKRWPSMFDVDLE